MHARARRLAAYVHVHLVRMLAARAGRAASTRAARGRTACRVVLRAASGSLGQLGHQGSLGQPSGSQTLRRPWWCQ